jgi:hypothetical protein
VYPASPPSLKFATAVGGPVTDRAAWPVAPGYRATELDVCKPFTAEAFAIHPDWARTNQAWRAEGNPLLAVMCELQRDLNGPGYQGRFRS